MKKFFKTLIFIIAIGLMGTFLSSCQDKRELLPDKKIYNVNWTIEDMTNTDTGTKVDNDMTIKFDKKNFILTDRNNAIDYKGTYKLKKAGTGYEIIMKFDDLKDPVIGGYGTRTYKDKNSAPDLLFEYRDRMYSFIGEYEDK